MEVTPVSGNNVPLQLTPPVVSLARTVNASISSSTEITFHVNTSIIRVYAIDADIYMKWGTDDVSASNFDEVIVAGQVFDFVVPDGIAAANFIERAASATLVCIEK